jgi:hypothetical protein
MYVDEDKSSTSRAEGEGNFCGGSLCFSDSFSRSHELGSRESERQSFSERL